jgi:hypothetical protein
MTRKLLHKKFNFVQFFFCYSCITDRLVRQPEPHSILYNFVQIPLGKPLTDTSNRTWSEAVRNPVRGIRK